MTKRKRLAFARHIKRHIADLETIQDHLFQLAIEQLSISDSPDAFDYFYNNTSAAFEKRFEKEKL